MAQALEAWISYVYQDAKQRLYRLPFHLHAPYHPIHRPLVNLLPCMCVFFECAMPCLSPDVVLFNLSYVVNQNNLDTDTLPKTLPKPSLLLLLLHHALLKSCRTWM